MPITACDNTDLPDPLSPTTATVLPAGTRIDTPRSASSTPPGTAKPMRGSWRRRMSFIWPAPASSLFGPIGGGSARSGPIDRRAHAPALGQAGAGGDDTQRHQVGLAGIVD